MERFKKTKYILTIFSSNFRHLNFKRYCIQDMNTGSEVMWTDSIYEVRIWMDLNGLKMIYWTQKIWDRLYKSEKIGFELEIGLGT